MRRLARLRRGPSGSKRLQADGKAASLSLLLLSIFCIYKSVYVADCRAKARVRDTVKAVFNGVVQVGLHIKL